VLVETSRTASEHQEPAGPKRRKALGVEGLLGHIGGSQASSDAIRRPRNCEAGVGRATVTQSLQDRLGPLRRRRRGASPPPKFPNAPGRAPASLPGRSLRAAARRSQARLSPGARAPTKDTRKCKTLHVGLLGRRIPPRRKPPDSHLPRSLSPPPLQLAPPSSSLASAQSQIQSAADISLAPPAPLRAPIPTTSSHLDPRHTLFPCAQMSHQHPAPFLHLQPHGPGAEHALPMPHRGSRAALPEPHAHLAGISSRASLLIVSPSWFSPSRITKRS
jgi:hypothetical protein